MIAIMKVWYLSNSFGFLPLADAAFAEAALAEGALAEAALAAIAPPVVAPEEEGCILGIE
jgi:hypothetical protein